jgi:ParB-like chromosome segregation protein Spo0J
MKNARDRATVATAPGLVLRDLAVQRWPIEKLIPYARNARTHSDEQVAQVAASIIEFGWTNPILVGADGVIIAGHARLAAARKLRMTEVPVIVLDNLTPTQRRALVLADNRLALNAGWDEEMLRVELESLEEDGFDLDLVGFTHEEIEDLLRDPEDSNGLTDEDALPEPQGAVVTKPGDVWLLGKHRVLCGDATAPADVGRLLNGVSPTRRRHGTRDRPSVQAGLSRELQLLRGRLQGAQTPHWTGPCL